MRMNSFIKHCQLSENRSISFFLCSSYYGNNLIEISCRISKSIVFKQNYAKIDVNWCHLNITREGLCFYVESTCVNIYEARSNMKL